MLDQTEDDRVMTYLAAISEALREEMRRDPNVLLMGEDIGGDFGGAFKVTQGLAAEFGPRRVMNTPLAELGFTGMATGMALMGLRPVVEMQFGDFISTAFDSIVQFAATVHYRWGGAVPIVVRAPSDGGLRSGPFHSQNPEAWFVHTPGLKVVAPATPADAKGLLIAAIRDNNPVIYFESKPLYRTLKDYVPAGDYCVPIGKAASARCDGVAPTPPPCSAWPPSRSYPLAAYWRGEPATPLVLFLTLVFTMLWFMLGVGGNAKVVPNAGITVLGVAYVGLLGSFAALLLKIPDQGVSIFLITVVAAVFYDVGGFFIGRQFGRRPLTAVSPNKTVEGLIGGMVISIGATLITAATFGPLTLGQSLAFGVALAIAAPLGDLAESLLKRDLGVKDMGTLLPGHGGLLDRFDGMLFVLPTAFYMLRILNVI